MPRITTIQARKGTAAEWSQQNPVLASGELGYDLTNKILKLGDGSSNWVSLGSINLSSSNITDFNSAISGVLPVKNLSAGNNISISSISGVYTINSSGGGGSSSSVRGSISTTGILSSFNISGGYSIGYLDVFQNGVKLSSGSDFTATDGTSVSLSNSVPSGTVLEYISLGASLTSTNYTKLDNISSSFNGSSTSFGLAVSGTEYYPVNANTLGIYVGGVAQEPISSYSISGSNIVFTEAPASGLTFWGVGYGTTAVATLNGIVPGSSGSPAISSSNDLTTGFYFPSSGNISVAGNLGIGTSSPSTLLDINNNKFRVRNSKTPSSTTDTGNTGDICWDSNYIYVCTATNTWARSSISRWYSLPSISGLQLWLDASDSSTLYDAVTGGNLVSSGGSVARWQDKSGNDYHLSETTNKPTRQIALINGLDAIRFDGSTSILRSSTNFPLTGNAAFSVFAVFRKTLNTKGHLYGWGDSATSAGATGYYDDGTYSLIAHAGGTNFNLSVGENSTWYVLSVIKSVGAINSTYTVRRNKTSIATSGHSTSTPNIISQPFTLGRWANYDLDGALGYTLQGEVGELIVYNSALSDTDRNSVENYLSTKWNIT